MHYQVNLDTNTTHTIEQLTVNKLARKARQSRVFSSSDKLKFHWRKASKRLAGFIPAIRMNESEALAIKSGQVFKRAIAISTVFLLSTSVGASNFGEDYSAIAALETSMPMDGIIISDNEGYMTKISPQTGESDRSQMTDKATHLVEPGQTLSEIAAKYEVSSQTIVWENNLTNKNALKVGQELSIPPVDGVSHKVKKGQNLDKVAKLYGVESSLIKTQNRLDSEYLFVGQELIIPGGKKIVPVQPKIIVQTPPREGLTRSNAAARAQAAAATPAPTLARNNNAPAAGKSFIFPTRGTITQYFHRGHYAYDIADPSRPPVWAAASGTVSKVSTGTWGGGYGNHVIIDHGNGYKTLYAHMGHVNVAKGQYINQGDPVGQMSNTGRVYGRTGIHLHFEIRKNGVKVNPGAYF